MECYIFIVLMVPILMNVVASYSDFKLLETVSEDGFVWDSDSQNEVRTLAGETVTQEKPIMSQLEYEQKYLANKRKSENYKKAIDKMWRERESCVSNLFNKTLFREDLSQAKHLVKIVEVFRKHCQNKSNYENCNSAYENHVFTYTGKDCTGDGKKIYMVVTQFLLEFICSLDAYSFSIINEEQGLQCIIANAKDLANCVETSLFMYIQGSGQFDSCDDQEFGKQCKAVMDSRKCILSAVSQCPSQMIYKLIDQVYEYFRESSSCQQHLIP